MTIAITFTQPFTIERLQANKDRNQFIVKGQLWFDKINGNTYNSLSIYIVMLDGEGLLSKKWIADLPICYGYGDYYLQRAKEFLLLNNLVSIDCCPIFLDYSYKDCKKSELHKSFIVNVELGGYENLKDC